MHRTEQKLLAQQAIKGLSLRIERSTVCWDIPLTHEESRHIALSLVAMVIPADMTNPDSRNDIQNDAGQNDAATSNEKLRDSEAKPSSA